MSGAALSEDSGELTPTGADPGIPGLSGFDRIGPGGLGAVYKAKQENSDREVAVKILAVAGVDDQVRRRFRREQEAMGALSAHPGIVTLYDSGFTAGGLPYLVMELMSGGSLADRKKQDGPLPWPERWVNDLKYLHDLRVLADGLLALGDPAGT